MTVDEVPRSTMYKYLDIDICIYSPVRECDSDE